MSDFEAPVDIGNRALQHCGAARMTAFTDDSVNASEVSFVYDKVRRAEMRRNVWRFSVRKAALRPVDEDTTTLAPAAYVALTAYAVGSVVSYDNRYWEAQTATTGQTPGTGNAWEVYFGPLTIQPHDATDTYVSGELVLSGGLVYRSLVSDNADVPPTANWLSLGAVSTALSILYPIGAGPASQDTSRNVFRLPNGFLREAPQDPRAGGTSYLGAPSGLGYTDANLEGNYIVSASSEMVLLRFAADVTLVRSMDPMFCEGLGARIALEVCEKITQSSEKLSQIGAAYNRFMSEARTVNGIETGPTEPPEDDFISCRQ